MDCSKLNEAFNCDGPEWLDVDDTPIRHWYFDNTGMKENPEHIKWRAKLVSEGYKNKKDIAEWADTKITTNTQRIDVVVEGKPFRSINEAARWVMKEYNIGRNTAIRYMKEGRSFTDKKYKGLVYNGSYTSAKYT